MVNPIALAIPFLLGGVVFEVRAARTRSRVAGGLDKRPIYRPADALADLGCGVVSQATGLFLTGVVEAGAYVAAFRLVSPFELPATSPWTWIFAFVAVDFCYYWWHRASHRVNVMWAAHVVHHQSEDYNLAVALRQAIFTPLTSIPFYLPLVLVGVSPLEFLTCAALNTLLQFWFHTRLIDRMPAWFEAVLNTPSHHRVHHGINPAYIDRNHGGVFILWDRLFGTFQAEEAEPVYGVVEGHPTYDVLAANVLPILKLGRNMARAGVLDGVKLAFSPPEWRPPSLGGPVVIPEPAVAVRYDPVVPPAVRRYAIAWFVPMSAVLLAMLWAAGGNLGASTVDGRWFWLGFLFIVATEVSQGALLDGRAYARRVEALRLAVVLPALILGALALARG